MHRLDRARRAIPLILGAITLVAVAVLLARDAFPERFPPGSHEVLGALPLALIALAYLAYQVTHRPASREVLKAVMLAVAFLFWAANQLWPDSHPAALFNDIAVALFVLDVFLVIVGWPASAPDESSAATYPDRSDPGVSRSTNLDGSPTLVR